MNTVRLHALVIPPEISGLEEQKYPTTALLTDGGLLLHIGRLCQQQRGTGDAFGGNPHPALARFARFIEPSVLQERKAKSLGKKANGLIVISHQQGQRPYVLCHNCLLMLKAILE